MPIRSTRLKLETLEGREVPASLAESFDSTSTGQVPAGWNTWGSDGQAGFSASTLDASQDRTFLSGGGSTRSARGWLEEDAPANVAVSAAIMANSLVPAQVIARGQNLDSASPTFYAAHVVRGTQIHLVRVEGGVSTTLASLQSNVYLSGVWINLTLIVQGTRLQVRAQRQDTGAWLSPFGDWQSRSLAALAVSDDRIRGPGQVGLARAAAYSGTVSFDDFRVERANGDVTPPTATATIRPVSRSLQAGTVAGIVRLGSQARDAGRIDRVEFLIDGALVARRTTPSYAVEFDTRNLRNGSHTLKVRAWDKSGNLREVERAFVVQNASLAVPHAPRHYDHIRYASLAYNGLAIGEIEQQLLRESVDLVVPNARYLSQINAIAPTTPQLAYSNVSNLYLNLLTDWLNYADRKHISRETAFYHVAEATPFTGDSSSSLPVDRFWNVQRGSSDYTSKARTGTTGDVPFAAQGEWLVVGYTERFGEIGFFLTSGARSGWTGVIEYPTQVNRLGQPANWKTLTISSDSTIGFKQSGRMHFEPPADWKPALVPGFKDRLFYIRIRTIAGDATNTPVAARILGRDYVHANGGSSGVIPAFDSFADRNRDGYLNAAEYAKRRAGFDARFAHESRLFYPHYGQMRFVTNPESRVIADWAVDYHRRFLSANPIVDGLFMDNSGGKAPVGDAKLIEDTDTYTWNFAAMLGSVSRAIAPKWLLANTSGGGPDAERVVSVVPATIEEFALRPLAHSWSQFEDMAATVARRLAAGSPSSTLILDTLSQGGSPTDGRTRLAALAYYYLLADPQRTMLMTWGGEEPASSWSRHWFDAIAFDVGRPIGNWSEFARGQDPANSQLAFRVYQREYGNALVLYKPLAYSPGKGFGGTSATASTHNLNGNYRILNADGSLGPLVNTVSLKNGEGAILVKT